MTNLRKQARGRPCQIRLPNICNFDPTTTVLCHLRLIGVSGMGLKSADLLGSWGCSSCHQAVDASDHLDYEKRRAALLEGMARTQAILVAERKIKW